jgi:hypothetical protein
MGSGRQGPKSYSVAAGKPGGAMRKVVGIFGVLAAMAGVEHGVGEILQGPVAPDGPVFRSWPGNEAFEVLDGEPALTVIPNLLASGIASVLVAALLGAWAVTGMRRRHGPLLLAGLSLLLLAVGGGFGPPLLGLILAAGASRLGFPARSPGAISHSLAAVYPWAFGAGLLGYLGLVPGTVVLQAVWGPPAEAVVYGLMMLAFGGVILTLAAARARCRIEAWQKVVPLPPRYGTAA